jgi:CubicO group peptidase (beta-lactamase class C family)
LRGARPRDRAAFVQDICHIPLDYVPRSRAVYSDLGFILLGFLAADVRGVSLREIVDAVLQRVRQPDETLTFAPPPLLGRRAAPTKPLDDDPRRRDLLVGDVQDDYASALGGVAGHAGLFGTARAVGDFARVVLGARRGVPGPPPFSTTRVAEFATRSTVPGSSRALGWDTMLPTSSCGTLMTDSAIGHVGFTGTSLWIDPGRDRYFVLLSNRTCGGGSLEQMRRVRRAFHDALGAF